ncbi:putative DNA primase/helicase [Bibersteinia trehalosi]|uniref:DUF927 domain-containing protein n=1 Tax=Bibersteinia trehalosi TaxID=47735 RepID=UPI001050B271|nr:DUF927 domain-containing protein [Bibersteinia trehalosi]TCT13731.1 putative DNA primase/helicase [Bibersteinia trehalosi]
MQNAPFYDNQPKDGISEIICLVGSRAWNALGYNKQEKQAYGEEWQLLTQAIGADRKRLPLVLGTEQLNEVHRLKLTNTQKVIRFCQFGKLSETQKTALLHNIAQNSPLETVLFTDHLGYEQENVSDYIQRLRTDRESQQLAEMLAAKNAENAPKKQPYIESRCDEQLNGLYFITPKIDKDTGEVLSEKTAWICNDLELAGKGKDSQGEYYYLFRWQNADEKEPRLEAVHFADFGSEAGWKQLKANGLQMSQSAGLTGKLAEHFHMMSKTVPSNWKITALAGWQNGAYILPNGEMIGEPKSPVYFTKKTMDNLGYTSKGTLESWQAEIADNVRGNQSMMLGIATALTAPMLAILGLSSFGVHLYELSTKGKSTTLHLANSVYGDSRQLVKTWNSTAYAIQQEAEARNDGFITLDEIGQAKDPKNLETIAYDLFNETGKMQGKKEGGNRKVNRWKITALSTGEKDLEKQLSMQGVKVHTGQLVRLLNVPMHEPTHFHQFPNAKAHADHLNEAVQHHFGTVGRVWIAFLAENGELVKSTYKAIRKKWLNLTENMSGQVQRVAGDRFAALETALQLAKNWTGWTEEENSQAMLKNFNSWKEIYGEATREETKIIETMMDWLVKHEAAFIEFPFNPEQRTPNNVYGFRILANQSPPTPEHFFIYGQAFRECLKEYPTNIVCTILHNSGILHKQVKPEKGYEFMHHIPKKMTGGKKIRGYKIVPIMADEEE